MAVLIALGSMCSCKKSQKILSVYSKDGKLVAEVSQDYRPDKKMAYFDIAINEATAILAEKLDCSEKNAKQKLWDDGYTIHTFFDESVQLALTQSLNSYSAEFDSASAITDLNGNLVAAYSNSLKDDGNNATKPNQPHSSLKPLGVYAQGIEKGIINWSSVYEDSPYKQLENADGSKRNWPKNADGTYSRKNVTVYEALQKSLNTVAVKCLKDVGVNNSIDFLQKSFSVPMFFEQYSSTIYGEEEIIGNVALGYLNEGVSTVDMAGYYQIFATGGSYEKPKSVYKIFDKDGKEVYSRQYSPKEVISAQTADIMNLMLRGVAKPGGTGEAAYCGDIEVLGKTGTGDANEESWFIGVTPQYSCAVWHGKSYKNIAPLLFSNTIKDIYTRKKDLQKTFGMHSNLNKIVYCEESGLSISSKCTLINVGYYSYDTQLDVCNIH